MKLLTTISALFFLTAALHSAGTQPFPKDALIVDVRTAQEFAGGHIPGAVLFPYDEIAPKASAFAALVGRDKTRPIIVYCRSGRRSAVAARELRGLGYTDVRDFGGIDKWKGPLER